MSASHQPLTARAAQPSGASGPVTDHDLVAEFTGAVTALRCDPVVLGDQTRLVEAVAIWLDRWQPASRAMTAGLQATAGPRATAGLQATAGPRATGGLPDQGDESAAGSSPA